MKVIKEKRIITTQEICMLEGRRNTTHVQGGSYRIKKWDFPNWGSWPGLYCGYIVKRELQQRPMSWPCSSGRKRRKRWRWKITLCITHFGEKSLPFACLFVCLFILSRILLLVLHRSYIPFLFSMWICFSKLNLGFSDRWREVFKSTCIFMCSHTWNYCGLICRTT